MEKQIIKILSIFVLSLVLSSCASVVVQHTYAPTGGINELEYSDSKESKGLVLLAATGKRTWGCGNYENAELRSIGFDRLPSNKSLDSVPDLVINSSQQGFMNLAYMLEPGTYAISYINIKVASSVSDVGYITAKRSTLLDSSMPKGGTFTVIAGESVYIGHFGLDCAYGPTLWRFYAEDRNSFNDFVAGYSSYYPYLSLGIVSYRLFSTKDFGHEFTLH